MPLNVTQVVQAHPRLSCWLLALLGAGLTAYEWHAIRYEHFYSPTASIIGPPCALLFATLGMLPNREGKATTETPRKIITAITILGFALGLLNWYAMTHL